MKQHIPFACQLFPNRATDYQFLEPLQILHASGLHWQKWSIMVRSRKSDQDPSLETFESSLHWQKNLETMFIFVVTLAAIGLERGAAMHLYSNFPKHSGPMPQNAIIFYTCIFTGEIIEQKFKF